jgi:hypothetical protein
MKLKRHDPNFEEILETFAHEVTNQEDYATLSQRIYNEEPRAVWQ